MTKLSTTIQGASIAELLDAAQTLVSDLELMLEPAPAKKNKPAPADEPAAPTKKKAKPANADDTRELIREQLREYSEGTDRKAAVKLLNKFATSVDEIEDDAVDAALAAIKKAIAAL